MQFKEQTTLASASQTDMIYLDWMSTTPMCQQAIEQWLRCVSVGGNFANPGSLHAEGQRARLHLQDATARFAKVIGALAKDIIWTSGATESNNLAISGALAHYRRKGRHIITMATEHKAVLEVCRQAQENGYELDVLPAKEDGLLDLDLLIETCRHDTVLVSVMQVNNETGVVQDIDAIADIVKSKGALLHVDAAQSLGKVPLDMQHNAVDLMSFSAHKFSGPKGVGALYVRSRPKIHLQPMIIGGGQQRNLRAGTIALPLIAAMAAASEVSSTDLAKENQRLWKLHRRFVDGMTALGNISLNGDAKARVPHNINLCFQGLNGEAMLYALNQRLAVSSGSACNAATEMASPVLLAMGQSVQQAQSAIRFSLGRGTTEKEIDMAMAWTKQQVQRLRLLTLPAA
jgi:cysteine desulfurase